MSSSSVSRTTCCLTSDRKRVNGNSRKSGDLLFVGITRAKEWLQLSCCKRRAIRGEVRPVIPSPFLNELPLEEMRRIESAYERDWFDDDDLTTRAIPNLGFA